MGHIRSCGLSLFTLSLVVAFSVLPAWGQVGVPCNECLASSQASRWDSLTGELESRARNLKRLQDLRARAEALGNSELVEKVTKSLAEAEADWKYVDKLAQALESRSYEGYLARRSAVVDSQVKEAEAELKVKTEVFRRLQQASESQKGKVLAEMRALANAENKQRWSVGFNSLVAGVAGLSKKVPEWLAEIQPQLTGATDQASKLKSLERLPKLAEDFVNQLPRSLEEGAKTLKHAKIGAAVAQKEYFEAATTSAQLVVSWALKANGASAMQQMGALPSIVGLSLDFVLLGQTHAQFIEAEGRFEATSAIEKAWQEEILRAGETLKNMRAERERTQEAIRRQAVLKQQAAQIRKELLQ